MDLNIKQHNPPDSCSCEVKSDRIPITLEDIENFLRSYNGNATIRALVYTIFEEREFDSRSKLRLLTLATRIDLERRAQSSTTKE